MKRYLFTFVVGFIALLFVGCGSSGKSVSKPEDTTPVVVSPSVTETPTTNTPTPPAGTDTPTPTPSKVVDDSDPLPF